jgi:hypothetical protein
MQFVRATHFTVVLGFALASGLHAQHGTGHAGVAGPGFAPGAPRGIGVQRPGPNLGGRPYPIRTDLPTPVGLNPPASAYTGISPGAFNTPANGYSHNYGHNGNYGHDRNYNYGNQFYPGYAAAPLLFPTYWDTGFSSFPSYDNSIPPVDPNAQALANSQEALAQQIQQLTSEVQQMKSSAQQQQQEPPAPTASVAPERRPPTPPVVLVLRDGQQISVESYAVMNQMFWNFSKRPVQKIPISNIDIAASAKATEANGGEFPPIGSAQ